ncbi:ABC transporter permease [Dactylosporangium aurantiacum]|uniref:ABC transporter permease n=1 Tax=Dactylosporangium aurantiacum TaxID=35754 RepID=A0A9Q9IEI3_9ACTN|nr:ABC transporter permease [Dactylosporangium aurantiacum]MDG6103540.1 ABC transporter permease [Dactylosporangium aurantiacum]UWZ51964.1 ABC transporter permease [Dactylosporangium aurantiacum]
MLSIARQTLRARWASFIGVFVALGLGACLLATTGLTIASTVAGSRPPVWYVHSPVVVTGHQTVSVTVDEGDGERYTETLRTRRPGQLPPDTAARLAALPGATVVVDHAVPVDLIGADGAAVRAHPWSSAGLHPYTFVGGDPPRGDDEVVLTAPTGHRQGDRVEAWTPLGRRTWTVAGVVTGPPAVYLTDGAAARLAGGRVDAIAVSGVTAGQVRAVTGPDAAVLTGDRRAGAEPDPDGELLVVAAALLGTTAGVALFVSVFVVAGTFAFAVAQRRRELALLRAAGATPRQVRRLVLGESLIVGVVAGAAGCAAGTVVAPPFAAWLAGSGFAPAGFTARFILWPLLAAFGVSLLVALTGAAVAARRAGRVRPIEALREASVDRRVMTAGRWVFGLLFLGGAGALVALVPGLGPEAIGLIMLEAQLAITGVALLAPVLAPRLAWLVGRLLLPGVAGALARDNARTAVRRTASTVAPILVTAGIAASTFATTATLWDAEERAAATRVAAPTLALPVSSAGIADPGTGVPTAQSVVYVRHDGAPEQFDALYAGTGLERVLRLPVRSGSVADLAGTDTVVVGGVLARAEGWRTGGEARLWLDDATPVRLRVVAVLAPSIDLDQTVLLPWALRAAHAPLTGADAVYLTGAPVDGARTVTAADYFRERNAEQRRLNHLALVAVLGMALVYTAIAIANTLVMAIGGRGRDLAVLRLGGGTPRQVLAMIGVEALLVGATGVLLAGVITAGMLAGLRAGLAPMVADPRTVVPWTPILVVAGVCVAITFVASVVPAALALRTPAARLSAIRE